MLKSASRSVFLFLRNMIMLCFSKGGQGRRRSQRGHGHPGGCRTQSALGEGLLDLVQHVPQQRRLVTLGVDGHRLSGLQVRDKSSVRLPGFQLYHRG